MRHRRIFSEDDAAGLDMTSMLDVVFIMLIFFIVTTSFIKEAGIEVNRPIAETASSQQSANIMVAISGNNEIWIDRRQIDVRAVRANIQRLRAENPDSAVVIQADSGARTGTLVEVMDQIRLAGIVDIAISALESGQ